MLAPQRLTEDVDGENLYEARPESIDGIRRTHRYT